jgi:hypothetical protein
MRFSVRTAAAALLIASLGACGQVAHAPTPPTLYTVTTIVMQTPGDPPRACAAMPLPDPPIGCGGPALRGLDLLTMPGVTRYWNGVLSTGTLRLVGTWDGHALTLTRSPEAASTGDSTPLPLTPCTAVTVQPAPGQVPPMVKQVMDDEALLKAHGIQVIQFGACGDSVTMTVVVADPATVAFLRQRYPGAQVAGWFHQV